MKVTLNAGHYPGHDRGAVGHTGLQEAEVSRDIMSQAAYYLRAVSYDVLEVQENILYQITHASNQFGADLFISIHCNWAANPDVRGTQTFCDIFGGDSEKLANCIQNQIVSNLNTVNLGVETGNFYILHLTDCPAVLVEVAFLSNERDEILLANKEKRDEIAAAIARGITDYMAGEYYKS